MAQNPAKKPTTEQFRAVLSDKFTMPLTLQRADPAVESTAAVDPDAFRARVRMASDAPIVRVYPFANVTEQLKMDDGAVDLSAFESGHAKLLWGHDGQLRALGSISQPKIVADGGIRYLEAEICIPRGDRDDVIKDIVNGTMSNVSIGWALNDRNDVEITEGNGDDSYDVMVTFNRWRPVECSIVNKPADWGVGFGRAAGGELPEIYKNLFKETQRMGTSSAAAAPAAPAPAAPAPAAAAPAPAAPAAAAAPVNTVQHPPADHLRDEQILQQFCGQSMWFLDNAPTLNRNLSPQQVETLRVMAKDEINPVGERGMMQQYMNFQAEASAAVAPQTTRQHHAPPGAAPMLNFGAGAGVDIGLIAQQRHFGRTVDGLNGEYLQEFRQRGDQCPESIDPHREIPFELFARDPRLPAWLVRHGVQMPAMQRDFTVGATPSGPAHPIFDPMLFIPALASMYPFFSQITILPMRTQNLIGVVETGTPTVTTTNETGAFVTTTKPTYSNREWKWRTFLGKGVFSRRFLDQTDAIFERIMSLLADSIFREIDKQLLVGTSGGAGLTGVLHYSGVPTYAVGSHGDDINLKMLVDLMVLALTNNAPLAGMQYITNPTGEGSIQKTPRFTNSTGGISDALSSGDKINNYPKLIDNNIPANYTKGTGTGLSPVIFGSPRTVRMVPFSGVEVQVDPFTKGDNQQVILRVRFCADAHADHVDAFALAPYGKAA